MVWSLFLLVLKTYLIDPWHPEINCEHCAHPGMIWYCRVLVVMLGLLWFIESMVVIAMGACWMCAWRHRRVFRPAINLAFLLPALTVGIWGQGLTDGVGAGAERCFEIRTHS